MAFDPRQMLVEGKRALVTGGGTGIGAAIATGLAKAGADVAVTYRSHRPDTVKAAVMKAGRRFKAIESDFELLDQDTAHKIIGEVGGAFGGIDILVNNAGIILRQDAIDVIEADWHRVLQINVDAAFYMAQAAGRLMKAQSSGRIINIASVLGFQGGLKVHAYTASKHALVGLTKSLCNEWASSGITVNAIGPGYTATDNTQALRDDPRRSAELMARIPAGRWAEPDDMAGAAVFLASDAASYINGHTLVVDGGWLAR
jgi:2-deoxy-D-gluconate 3-dehydrogenase